MDKTWEYETDLLVVGSGGGGMVAALVGKHLGLEVLVLEKGANFGGSTARSGGAIWIPNNYLLAEAGVEDSFEKARLYLSHTVGESSPQDLQDTYLRYAPKMLAWLRDHSCVQFQRTLGYADYYPERPGGVPESRSLEPVPFNGRLLGVERSRLLKPMAEAPGGLAITGSDYQKLGMMVSTWAGKQLALSAGLRWVGQQLSGERPLTMGQALAARLRYAMMLAGIPLWLETPMEDLIIESERVVGVLAKRAGQRLRILAHRGVVLAAGGFAHNPGMRQKYLPQPTSTEWTVACKTNTGDAIQAGMQLGAAVRLMDDAWWGPTSRPPGEEPFFHVGERAYPGAVIVNQAGKRFVNESAPYIDVIHAVYENHCEQSAHIPGYFIFDQHYRNRYMFGLLFPILPIPRRYFENDYFQRSQSIEGLANECGIEAAGLADTVSRFNQFARSGRDLDFGRGESAYDRYYGDPTVHPNPNLAPLVKPPFYAVKLWPGDLGTKGGLVTDTHARVLQEDGTAIPGLYAIGNTMASVMGDSYPGAGATIGPAMTFGYLAALHAVAGGTRYKELENS